MLMITHNLGIMSSLADRVAVLYAGRLLESGPAAQVLRHPAHPYTEALLRSMPRIEDPADPVPIEGSPPDLLDPPPGCPFFPRCPYRGDPRCENEMPARREIAPGHIAATFYDMRRLRR
jgi:oligopeptide/dipeptide ABC transporter ATP-binding protein